MNNEKYLFLSGNSGINSDFLNFVCAGTRIFSLVERNRLVSTGCPARFCLLWGAGNTCAFTVYGTGPGREFGRHLTVPCRAPCLARGGKGGSILGHRLGNQFLSHRPHSSQGVLSLTGPACPPALPATVPVPPAREQAELSRHPN